MIKQSILVCFLLSAVNVSAITSQEIDSMKDVKAKGLAIAEEFVNRDAGWKSSTASMKMILINQLGDTSKRDLTIKSFEVPDDGDKSLSIFNNPRDIKGTALLSFAHPLTPNEQWLYLPVLKRVKRIASANKSGPFMGSEFAFEDFTSFEVEKYEYEYLRDEACNKQHCFVNKRIPKYEYSGYSYVISWLDKEKYRVQKIEFYDRKKQLLKTLSFSDYQLYLGKHWRALRYEMINHQTGKSTHLVWSQYQLDAGLTEKDFHKNSLKRIR